MSQKVSQKIGEVKFRKKLTPQHLGKTLNFHSELTSAQMLSEIKKRVKVARKDFENLSEIGVNFTPFLEIGAEYGSRATLLENRFDAAGVICDISQDALVAATDFAKRLKFKKLPQRICADGENLPFTTNSFSFVFCYQTLHHFENPKKLISEIIRVTKDDGYFFFAEEPVKQTINLNLWRRPTNLRLLEKILKYFLILPFISEIGKTETDFGIFEGTFDLKTWEKILSPFNKIKVRLSTYPVELISEYYKNHRKNWLNPSIPLKLLISLFGGGIKGLAKIEKGRNKTKNLPKNTLLICPDCKLENSEIPLKKDLHLLICSSCGRTFKSHSGIWQLLNKNLAVRLYGQS